MMALIKKLKNNVIKVALSGLAALLTGCITYEETKDSGGRVVASKTRYGVPIFDHFMEAMEDISQTSHEADRIERERQKQAQSVTFNLSRPNQFFAHEKYEGDRNRNGIIDGNDFDWKFLYDTNNPFYFGSIINGEQGKLLTFKLKNNGKEIMQFTRTYQLNYLGQHTSVLINGLSAGGTYNGEWSVDGRMLGFTPVIVNSADVVQNLKPGISCFACTGYGEKTKEDGSVYADYKGLGSRFSKDETIYFFVKVEGLEGELLDFKLFDYAGIDITPDYEQVMVPNNSHTINRGYKLSKGNWKSHWEAGGLECETLIEVYDPNQNGKKR